MDTLEVCGSEYHARPLSTLMMDVVQAHCANDTAFLDYFSGSDPMNNSLVPINGAFCDTMILFFFVPEYHTLSPGQTENSDGVVRDSHEQDGSETRKVRRIKKAHTNAIRSKIQTIFAEADVELKLKDVLLVNSVVSLSGSRKVVQGDTKRDLQQERETGAIRTIEQENKDRHRLNRKLQESGFKDAPVPDRRLALEEEIGKQRKIEYYSQHVKIALPNQKLRPVLELVREGRLGKEGFYLQEIDITHDCAGTFRKWPTKASEEPPALVPSLIKNGFRMQTSLQPWCDKTILKNDTSVSRHTCSFMTRSNPNYAQVSEEKREKLGITFPMGLEQKSKGYSKPCDNLEKRSLRARTGHHIQTSQNIMYDRVARGFDGTRGAGYTRVETTLNVFRPYAIPRLNHLDTPLNTEAAENVSAQVIQMIPKECVLRTPHELFFLNWCRNIKHCLIVVDARTDSATVVCAINSLTGTRASTELDTWSRNYRYVLERMGLGRTPTDIITMHRGRDYEKLSKPNRRKRKRGKATQEIDASDSKSSQEGEEATFNDEPPLTSSAASTQLESEEGESINTLDMKCAYAPDYVIPKDKAGITVTSQRFFRMPEKLDQVHLIPETRFHTDHLGKGFRTQELPPGWNRGGSKIGSIVLKDGKIQIRSNGKKKRILDLNEELSDADLARMTTERSGMLPNKYIAPANWPNLNPAKRQRYASIQRAESCLPIVKSAFLRKDALLPTDAMTAMERMEKLPDSIVVAQTERALMLTARIYDLSQHDQVMKLREQRCNSNGRGKSAEQIEPGEHNVIAFECKRVQTSAACKEISTLKIYLEFDEQTTCDYNMPNLVKYALANIQEELKDLSYQACQTAGGNLWFLGTDGSSIGKLIVPAKGGIQASQIFTTEPAVTIFPSQSPSTPNPPEHNATDLHAETQSDSSEPGRSLLPELAGGLLQQPKLFKDIVALGIKPKERLRLKSAARQFVQYRMAERWFIEVCREGDPSSQLLNWKKTPVVESIMRKAREGAILTIKTVNKKEQNFTADLSDS